MIINYIHEPTPLQCGQAVLAMLTEKNVEEIIDLLGGNDRETNWREMKKIITECGMKIDDKKEEAFAKDDLPEIALLSLETPECWHWSLYANGLFYDPQRKIMDDFPLGTKRKYFWKITLEKA